MSKEQVISPEQEQLIADYLAYRNQAYGNLADSNQSYSKSADSQVCTGDIDDEIRQELEADNNFAQEFKRQLELDRQVRFALTASKGEDFAASITQAITKESGSSSQPTLAENSEQSSNVIALNSRKIKVYNWVAACACLMVAVFVMNFDSYLDKPVGAISKTAAIAFTDGNVPGNNLIEGQQVFRGEFELESGYAEILLSNGVNLVIEAPVAIDFKSDDHIHLLKGNLVARVPPNAIGFKVDTPSSSIVDLGTEFGVAVDPDGKSQVHVIDGEIKVRASKEHEYEYLTEDQARAYNLEQQVATIQSQPSRFMRSLPGKSSDNPDYMHWSFDDVSLEQDSYSCSGQGIDGMCVGANAQSLNDEFEQWQKEGVFGESIYFDGKHNWLETSYPGIGGNKPRTLAFWVKVPEDFAVTEGFGILSWGLLDNLSAWQVSINPLDVSGPIGRLRIGTYHGEVIGTTDLRDNQWHHIAIVLFGGEDANLSTHVLTYIDGELEYSYNKSITRVDTKLDHPASKPLIMGRNLAFNKGDPNKENKFFRGGVDEVYIFDSALNQQQIKNLLTNNQL